MRKARSAIKFVGLAMIAACVFAGCVENQHTKQQLAEMQSQINELQSTMSDLNLRMEEMNSSLFVLRETAKANRDTLKKVQQDMNSPTVYIDQPPETAAPAAPSSSAPTGAPPAAPAAGDKALPPLPLPAGSGKAPADEEKAFQAAVAQVDRQNWGLAVYDLNAFVAQHPNSVYLPRARYALGESYRNLSEHAQAAREYERCVAAGDAAGHYAPRALYWLVQCYRQLGQAEKARQAEKRLQQEYPDSPEAKKLQLEASR